MNRPVFDTRELEITVSTVLEDVRKRRRCCCSALYENSLIKLFSKIFVVSEEEFAEAEKRVSEELKNAIKHAKSNIEKFHAAQTETLRKIETTEGVFCWRKSVAIERVGFMLRAELRRFFPPF